MKQITVLMQQIFHWMIRRNVLVPEYGALGIKPSDIGGCPVGCLGIPEFGTDFVISDGSGYQAKRRCLT